MGNKMWGGRFASGPAAIMEKINTSIDFDWHLYRQDIAASKAHAEMLAKQGIIAADDARRIAQGLDTILSEIGSGKFKFKRAARRHSYERRGAARRADRPGRRAAAHRALAQRSGRDRFPAVGADADRRHRRAARRLPAGAGREGAGACGHGDARLHASADRAAGDVRASSSRLRRDGAARPRPVRRRARAAERIARSAPRRSPAHRFRSIAT